MTNRETLTLDQVVNEAIDTTLRDGGHIPMLIVEGDKQSALIPLELADTFEGRQMQMLMLGTLLSRGRTLGTLAQVFFISEGWMKSVEPGETDTIRPALDPNRKEVLTVFHQDISDDAVHMRNFEMIRENDGQLVELKPHTELYGEEHQAESPLLQAFVTGFLGLAR